MPSASLRRSYHCDLKIAACLGVLDPQVAPSLPASTLHRFRSSDYSSLVGLDLYLGESHALVKRFAQSRWDQAVYAAYLRVNQTLIRVLSAGRSLPVALSRRKKPVVSAVHAGKHSVWEARCVGATGLASESEAPCEKAARPLQATLTVGPGRGVWYPSEGALPGSGRGRALRSKSSALPRLWAFRFDPSLPRGGRGVLVRSSHTEQPGRRFAGT